jgi:hypothetical protein
MPSINVNLQALSSNAIGPQQSSSWDGVGRVSVGTPVGARSQAGQSASAQTAPADPADEDGDPNEYREQLRRRVQRRVAQLQQALADLDDNESLADRAQSLAAELQAAHDATSGGWDHVGEVEAAQLVRWLIHSESLIAAGSTPQNPGRTN